MKYKHIPSLLLPILLSFAILIGIPLIFFFTSEYPADPILRLGLSSKQSFGLIAFILLLFWLGAGFDALLSHIKDVSKRRLTSLVVYLGSFFICVALPLAGIFLIYRIFATGQGWVQLPAPPEIPVSIAAASNNSVVIETESGRYYYCIVNNSSCWQPEDKPDGLLIGAGDNMNVTGNVPGSAPPSQVVDILGIVYSNGTVLSETHFAILEDGQVWYLTREINNYSSAYITGLAAVFLVPFAGGSAIFLIGAGVASASRWLAGQRKREP
jgi:hypothetical protein